MCVEILNSVLGVGEKQAVMEAQARPFPRERFPEAGQDISGLCKDSAIPARAAALGGVGSVAGQGS